MVIVYGPNEDEVAVKKEEFWKQLAEFTKDTERRIIIWPVPTAVRSSQQAVQHI